MQVKEGVEVVWNKGVGVDCREEGGKQHRQIRLEFVHLNKLCGKNHGDSTKNKKSMAYRYELLLHV